MSINKSKNEKQKLVRTILRNDLGSFIQKSFHTVNPSTKYLHNWHIDLIAEYLKACENGEIKRLIVNMPPRNMKSLCASVAWPAWLLGQDPSRRIIVASYAQALSLKHSQDCRLIINSNWYRSTFPEVILAADQNEKSKFVTTKRGYRIAASTGGSITGEGGNYLIIDDPHNPINTHSDLIRNSDLNWFDQTFSSRLDDKKNGVFVLIMQRLHKEDLTAYLLDKTGNKWEELSISAIAEKRTTLSFGSVKKIRNKGGVLHSKRENKEELERIKQDMGSYNFTAQYQQSPISKSGGIIKRQWLRYYRDIHEDNAKITQSWDTAIKVGQNNDYSVCTTWSEAKNAYYLLSIFREKMEYPELKRSIIAQAEKWQPTAILIEDKASGQSLLQDLRMDTKLPLIAINPIADKVTRMAVISPIFEAGKVALPRQATWLSDLEIELYSFPDSTHDDQIDSISQYFNWCRGKLKRGGPTIKAI